MAKTRTKTRTIVRYARRARRRAVKTTIPLGLVAGLAPTAIYAYEGFRLPGEGGGLPEAAHRVTMRLTGYEWKGQYFSWPELTRGWAPLLGGIVVHKLANKAGLNRMLAKSGIPLVRI